MHPVLQAMVWIGLAGAVTATLSAGMADAIADQERRQGLADRDAVALLKIYSFGVPLGRYMNIWAVFTDWYTQYSSSLIRQLTYVARTGIIVGSLLPLALILGFLGLW
ncbi:hypothetical protein [Brevundimonas sp.]|uniref:hypothetical protein n=1 Tax=Brevundimonas sp. TaxID=1871086 RepID=UPI002FCCAF10